nr:hypothetical protein CFP56_71859 [Quercus suber]
MLPCPRQASIVLCAKNNGLQEVHPFGGSLHFDASLCLIKSGIHRSSRGFQAWFQESETSKRTNRVGVHVHVVLTTSGGAIIITVRKMIRNALSTLVTVNVPILIRDCDPPLYKRHNFRVISEARPIPHMLLR